METTAVIAEFIHKTLSEKYGWLNICTLTIAAPPFMYTVYSPHLYSFAVGVT